MAECNHYFVLQHILLSEWHLSIYQRQWVSIYQPKGSETSILYVDVHLLGSLINLTQFRMRVLMGSGTVEEQPADVNSGTKGWFCQYKSCFQLTEFLQKAEKVSVEFPSIIRLYNKFMGNVDVPDSLHPQKVKEAPPQVLLLSICGYGHYQQLIVVSVCQWM